jgi:hypothetical protein
MIDLKKDEENSRRPSDPTGLTMDALMREAQHVRDLLLTKVECLAADMARVDKTVVDLPSSLNKDISHVREFLLEKFNTVDEQFRSVQTQFTERDRGVDQAATDSKVRVDAALSAQKEAVGEQNKSNALAIGKTETGFTKSIDQMSMVLSTNNAALDSKIVDIKARLDKLEGSVNGRTQIMQESHATTFNAANIIGMIVGLFGLVIAAITIMQHIVVHQP